MSATKPAKSLRTALAPTRAEVACPRDAKSTVAANEV
jgi:hypothetical protein